MRFAQFVSIFAIGFVSLGASGESVSCPSEAGVYVQQAGTWVPMRGAYARKIIPGHMKAMGDAGIIAIFPDGESADRLTTDRPTFCAVGSSDVTLLSLQARGKERRVVIAKSANWKGAYARHQRWFEPEAVVPITITKESDHAVVLSPDLPIRNGEYILFMDLPESIPGGKSIDPHLVKGYDFGFFSR